MKAVLAHLARRKLAYSKAPLFSRMRDESLSPRVRLSCMPALAFFIMSFGDLNRYLLREEPALDMYQERINAHTREDDHHWPWFLEDLEKIGWNSQTTTTDALRALWSEDNYRSRLLMYELCALVQSSHSVERLAIVEAIEETGNVLFALTQPLADVLDAELSIELRYMGLYHFELESGHLQNTEHAELATITLHDRDRKACIVLVDRVFDIFLEWTQEALQQIDRRAKESSVGERPAA